MAVRNFVLQIQGPPAASDLAGVDRVHERVQFSTVLRVSVRDQAALQGLLRRVNDLGLTLLDLHAADSPHGQPTDGRGYEVTVDGPVGEVAVASLSDYVGPVQTSSRFAFHDPVLMGQVLTRLLDRGADLEYPGEPRDSTGGAGEGAGW